jgi:hypothetical protein
VGMNEKPKESAPRAVPSVRKETWLIFCTCAETQVAIAIDSLSEYPSLRYFRSGDLDRRSQYKSSPSASPGPDQILPPRTAQLSHPGPLPHLDGSAALSQFYEEAEEGIQDFDFETDSGGDKPFSGGLIWGVPAWLP